MSLSDKLDKARECIKHTLKAAKNPVLLWSSGKDSMLLLHLLREQSSDIPLLWFRADLLPTQKQFAERIIKDLDLTVFGYPPANVYLMGGGNLTAVREYDIAGARLPVLSDVALSDQCKHKASHQRMPRFDYQWDVSFAGWKKTDSHPMVGDVDLDNLRFGSTTFAAPLKDFSDADVWEAIRQIGIPYDQARYDEKKIERDPDSLLVCAECFRRAGLELQIAA